MNHGIGASNARNSWPVAMKRFKRCSTFYASLLGLQRGLAADLTASHNGPPNGALAHDLELLRPGIAKFLEAIAATGPELLAVHARRLLDGPQTAIDQLLTTCWNHPSDRQFFAKAVLQPYARCSRRSWRDAERSRIDDGGKPLSVLRRRAAAVDVARRGWSAGGGRAVAPCATCLTVWPFRRVLCAHCGEEDERKLGYFQSPAYDHLRIDACDTCRRYLKTVDLTRLGLAVPLVDEVAGAPLDAWAREQGYEKIELNLVGL